MVNIREVTALLNTRVLQFIIGTVCLLMLMKRLDWLFQLDESQNSGESKNYRKRVGRIAKNKAKSMIDKK